MNNATLKVKNADLIAMKKMLNMCNKLEESCKECYRKIDDSKRVYDAPTGE